MGGPRGAGAWGLGRDAGGRGGVDGGVDRGPGRSQAVLNAGESAARTVRAPYRGVEGFPGCSGASGVEGTDRASF